MTETCRLETANIWQEGLVGAELVIQLPVIGSSSAIFEVPCSWGQTRRMQHQGESHSRNESNILLGYDNVSVGSF